MTNQGSYLIDANSLITPYNAYYAFDLAAGFWTKIEEHIRKGHIVMLDVVREEILRGNDELTEWMRSASTECLDHRDPTILENYGRVLMYIQTNPCYSDAALREWSMGNVADAWLIATAISKGYTIVTFEQTAGNGMSQRHPSKNPKIPDVAAAHGIKCVSLFQMMRDLEIRL